MAFLNLPPLFLTLSREEKMPKSRPQPPRPDRRRSIRGSFSWIDHRFLREGFDEGLTRLEKLLYFVLVAVSNQDGVSFYSDVRLAELLDARFPHELVSARNELVARDLIAYEGGIYQVLDLPAGSPRKGRDSSRAEPMIWRRMRSCSPAPPESALANASICLWIAYGKWELTTGRSMSHSGNCTRNVW